MSALTGKNPGQNYQGLLHLSGPGPLTTTPRAICMGDGTVTPLSLTLTKLFINGVEAGTGGGGGTELTSYATQIATLPDHPDFAELSGAVFTGGISVANAMIIVTSATNASAVGADGIAFVRDANSVLFDCDVLPAGAFVYTPPAGNGKLSLTQNADGSPDKLSYGTGLTEVSISASAVTFGATAQGTWQTALGGTTVGKALFTTANSGAALDTLGFGAAGKAIVALTTPAAVNEYLGEVTKTTTADVSRANAATITTSVADDPELAGYPLEANTNYEFLLHVVTTSVTAAGVRVCLFVPSFARDGPPAGVVGFASTPSGGAGVGTCVSATLIQFFNATYNIALATSVAFGTFRTGSTGGNACLRWCQNISNAANTTRHANSFLTIRKLKS